MPDRPWEPPDYPDFEHECRVCGEVWFCRTIPPCHGQYAERVVVCGDCVED